MLALLLCGAAAQGGSWAHDFRAEADWRACGKADPSEINVYLIAWMKRKLHPRYFFVILLRHGMAKKIGILFLQAICVQ